LAFICFRFNLDHNFPQIKLWKSLEIDTFDKRNSFNPHSTEMNRKIYLLITLFFCLTTAFTFTQEGEELTEKIIAKLENYRLNFAQEKVYLHFDKPYYMAGETMWFKGYLFDGPSHQLDTTSKVLYVELLDEVHGKVILSQTWRCDGTTHGNIALPDTLSEGVYKIRAFTNYMRNYSEEFFFYQEFKIWGNGNHLAEEKSSLSNEDFDVQFFPEAGNSVVGLNSRIAYKAINSSGKGIDIQGFVLENMKDTVVAFQSEHLGMGYFNYTSEAQKNYTAFVKKNNGKYRKFSLPKALEKGYTMSVDNLTSKDRIKIFVANNSPKPDEIDVESEDIIVVAHQRGQLCFMAKGTDTQKSISISMPKNKIPEDGIVQITLLNAKGEPLCERLIFNNQERQLKLKITPDKTIYKNREKVTLNLEAIDAEGKPVEGNFSVAVTDAHQVLTDPHQENVLTYLLLSSDASKISNTDNSALLRGKIEKPAYYFEKENANAARHLDILMMTQGWRRFLWRDLMADKMPKINYFYEAGLDVTGSVRKLDGQIDNNVTLTLIIKNDKKKPQMQLTSSDSTGRFGFYELDFYDTTQVFVQSSRGGNKDLNISIDSRKPFPKVRIVKIPYNPIEINENELADFLKNTSQAMSFDKKSIFNKNQMLESVNVRVSKLDETDPRRTYTRATNTIIVDNNVCRGATNVLQMIQGRVPGVMISPNARGGYDVEIRGTTSMVGSNEPFYLMDGMPVDVDALFSVVPCNIERIDVLKGADATLFGSVGAKGVISIFTKRTIENSDVSKNKSSPTSVQKRIGYETPREFYAPKYDVSTPDNVRPDFRSTIYWQPNVKTDATGKATLTYWSSDAKTNVRVIAEGVSSRGVVGVGKFEYGVK
jgi:TonB-dependent Receptor Plug Domain